MAVDIWFAQRNNPHGQRINTPGAFKWRRDSNMQEKACTWVSRPGATLTVLLELEARDKPGCLLTYHKIGKVPFCQHFQPIASCTRLAVEKEHIPELK